MTEENITENKKIEEIKEVKSATLLENKNAKEPVSSIPFANKSAKEGSFTPLILVMLFSLILASLWDKVPAIKNSINYILNPSAGVLLNWNLSFGMLIIIFVITLLSTLVQKYATDQKTLRELRTEQKEIQKQMKEFKEHPEKLMELQKKQFAMMPKQMKLTMRGVMYTGIPLILFFRWFSDYFIAIESPKFFGFLGWFWFYFIFAVIFGSILKHKKLLDVV